MNTNDLKFLLDQRPKRDKKDFILSRIVGKKVLDLGCIGHTWERSITDVTWLHRSIINSSNETLGIDFLEDDVAILNSKGYHNIKYGDATRLNLGEKFDTIVLGDLIEHVHDISGLFETFTKHLNLDGEVLITTPNPFFINHFISILLTNQIGVNKEHVFWFDPKVISELADRFSFDIIHVEWLKDSDFIRWSDVNKKSYKSILFYVFFKLLSPLRMIKLLRPYFSSEFGVVVKLKRN